MKQQDVGILVTLSMQDDGDYLVRFDDVRTFSENREIWKIERIDTEFSLSEEKFNERADYGMTDDVKQKGNIPVRFGLGSNLLSSLNANRKIIGF